MTIETDVAIVGAGASGLSAAKALRDRGITFEVLEGSHRIGGRAYSEEIAPGVWFDLGCSYLHLGDTNPFKKIAADHGVPLCLERQDQFDERKIRLYHNGTPITGERFEAWRAYSRACDAAITDSVERGEDRAILDLIDAENAFSPIYMNGMASLNTLDIDETSAADYHAWGKDYTGGVSDIPVPEGYGNLVKTWGADVPVSLNCRVEKIDHAGKDIVIETTKGACRAKAVIVTVSTGILGAGDIQFTPGLPDWKMAAVRGLPCGTENKICLHFDRDVFGPDGTGFHKTWTDEEEGAGFEASVMGLNTAIVFTGGRHAVWLERQGQQAGHDFALDRVADVFGNDIRRHVTRSIVTAWTTEPWTRGAYSCALPGQAHQREELAKPLDGRIFFAGEATEIGNNSTCHGAYLSGRRVAKDVATALGHA